MFTTIYHAFSATLKGEIGVARQAALSGGVSLSVELLEPPGKHVAPGVCVATFMLTQSSGRWPEAFPWDPRQAVVRESHPHRITRADEETGYRRSVESHPAGHGAGVHIPENP